MVIERVNRIGVLRLNEKIEFLHAILKIKFNSSYVYEFELLRRIPVVNIC